MTRSTRPNSVGCAHRIGIACVGLLVLAATAGGCGRPYSARVGGVVTLDGKPLDRGNVVFHPEGAGSPVVGRIDGSGRYELKTGQSASLPPGDYVATVQALSAEPNTDMTPEQIFALYITPMKYQNRATSGLGYTVAPGRNRIDIELHTE